MSMAGPDGLDCSGLPPSSLLLLPPLLTVLNLAILTFPELQFPRGTSCQFMTQIYTPAIDRLCFYWSWHEFLFRDQEVTMLLLLLVPTFCRTNCFTTQIQNRSLRKSHAMGTCTKPSVVLSRLLPHEPPNQLLQCWCMLPGSRIESLMTIMQ